ncbi:MAG TPA: DNA polymerase III subunit [Acidimicrobiia bacterium]|nr:DNA polymerase III subunit [Acidimicrobiia bacterium]
MWEDVVGQERAVATLERAAARPSHAYLLVGPRGSGVETAAREFAALMIGAGGDERALTLVRRGMHPDVVEFEPGAASYSVKDDVRARILPEAMRAPIEADRKVLLILEAEKLRGNQNEAANAMLKTLEEPPPRTVIILVTSIPEDLLPTIRSRCQQIDFEPTTDDVVAAALAREGVDSGRAQLAASLSGGQLARARAFAGPLASFRATFARAPARIDGTGAKAIAIAEELDAAVEAAAEQVAQLHREELEAFDAEMERHGYSDRDAQRMRRRIDDRHKREVRRTRIDLLLEGVTVLESVYRDALAAPAPALNADQPPLAVSPRGAAEALDACREAREAILINEKGIMRLTALVMALPAATTH